MIQNQPKNEDHKCEDKTDKGCHVVHWFICPFVKGDCNSMT